MEDTMNRDEEVLQAECYKWFHNTYHAHRQMLFHVDNNSWNAVIGAKKKALGVCAGVSDLIFIVPGAVMFLEMKCPGKTQLPEQIEFERKVTERGQFYTILYSFEEFKKFIKTYIDG